ncbi:MAG: GNAT family N-acetyltransferase [Erysipelotrichaceae bacterium]
MITISEDNIDHEHLCCIIRKKIKDSGVELKREYIRERLKYYRFVKEEVEGRAFIEYVPLEYALVPINGNFIYIHCLWVDNPYKHQGYGKELINECINYSRENGYDGVCMLGYKKQKNWLSDQSFVKHYGFVKCDETLSGYELLCLSFNGSYPCFSDKARNESIDTQNLRIYYSYQCPFIYKRIEKLKEYCTINNVECEFVLIDSAAKAKELPGPFNNFALFYKGRLVETNQADEKTLAKILTQ